MVNIPTTDRKFYDTERKVNTLQVYAQALMPAARTAQEMVTEQQQIKMDSYASEARLKMDEATNQWRVDNQANPNDPNALKDLQNQYNNILGSYRNQIDPLYRSKWDIAGNKLKSAYDLNNQAWGFKQNQENVKLDIAKQADVAFKLAQSYGVNGNEAMAVADYKSTYDRLLDYGAKNLGATEAAKLLNEFESNYYESYVTSAALNNPKNALNVLKNKDISTALGAVKTEKLKNLAEAQQKKMKKEEYLRVYDNFTKKPTQAGLDYLIKNNPKMDKKTEQQLTDLFKKSPNYEATSTYKGIEDANQAIVDLAKMDFQNEDEAFKALVNMSARLQRTQIAGNLSNEQYWASLGKLKTVYADESIRKNINQVIPTIVGFPDVFTTVSSTYNNMANRKMLKDIQNTAMTRVIDEIVEKGGSVDEARKIYHKAREEGIRYVNPEIGDAKEGDTITANGRPVKLLSFDAVDALVSFIK